MVLNKVYDANQKRKMATIAGKAIKKNLNVFYSKTTNLIELELNIMIMNDKYVFCYQISDTGPGQPLIYKI